jgi:hypothetical protein
VVHFLSDVGFNMRSNNSFNSLKAASKAILFTFLNRNRFSLYQDWRVIIICNGAQCTVHYRISLESAAGSGEGGRWSEKPVHVGTIVGAIS